jgi:hypothetical protein
VSELDKVVVEGRNKAGTIENLQSLRAFAAINVVMFHVLGTGVAYGFTPQYLSIMEGWGANGVDLFFILSGFVMLHSQFQKKRSVLAFLKLRVLRIVPIYWFVTSLVVAAFSFLPSDSFNNNAPSIDWVIQSMFFLSGAMSQSNPVLMVGWTLEWEMLFYLVFGVSLLFPRWNSSYFFVFFVLAGVALLSSNLIVFEFLAGMLIAYIYNRFDFNHRYGLLLGLFGVLLLFSSINEVFDTGLSRVFYWGIPSGFIVVGAVYAKSYGQRHIKYLGDASYSIYLIHVLAISVFYKASGSLSVTINNDALALMALFFSISCGAILYSFIEKPLTAYIKSIVNGRF